MVCPYPTQSKDRELHEFVRQTIPEALEHTGGWSCQFTLSGSSEQLSFFLERSIRAHWQ